MPQLEALIGQHLMIGIAGTELTPETLEVFRRTHAGGLIIFRPNFANAQSFIRLLTELEEKLGRRLLVAVDHEGGRVLHLNEGITIFPDNLAVGSGSRKQDVARQGEIEAVELRRLGFDLNLAPTVDVLAGRYSPNIGIRSYGCDAEIVARMSAARIRGMQAKGLSACAKHFPGLGSAPVDPHLALPQLSSDWEEMQTVHLKPFQAAIEAGVHAVMSSHPVYSTLDTTNVPATFSRRLISGYLRKDMKFQGLILSDDLEMGALERFDKIGERAVRAVDAGHDMVLLCHDPQGQVEAFDALYKAYEGGRLKKTNLEASAERVAKLRALRPKRFEGGEPAAEPIGAELAREMARRGAGGPGFGEALPSGKPAVIFPRISELAGRIFVEQELMDEKAFVKNLFQRAGRAAAEILITDLNISRDQWTAAITLARKNEWTVFFCYDAHLDAAARRLLEQMEKEMPGRFAVVLMRDPYDEEFLVPNTPYSHAYGFRAIQLKAALYRLFNNGLKTKRE